MIYLEALTTSLLVTGWVWDRSWTRLRRLSIAAFLERGLGTGPSDVRSNSWEEKGRVCVKAVTVERQFTETSLCVRTCTLKRDLLAATLILALSSSFSSSTGKKSLFFLKNVHTFSSDIWTQEAYLQDPAAVTDSDETYNKHSPNMDLFMNLGTRRHRTQMEVKEEAPPIPVRLQAFCGGDGLGPEPLRCATVSWSDVSPRFSSTSLTRICLHDWEFHLNGFTSGDSRLSGTKKRTKKKRL